MGVVEFEGMELEFIFLFWFVGGILDLCVIVGEIVVVVELLDCGCGLFVVDVEWVLGFCYFGCVYLI